MVSYETHSNSVVNFWISFTKERISYNQYHIGTIEFWKMIHFGPKLVTLNSFESLRSVTVDKFALL